MSTYQQRKEERIQQAIDTLTIEEDILGVYAQVPSTTSPDDSYVVAINESEGGSHSPSAAPAPATPSMTPTVST